MPTRTAPKTSPATTPPTSTATVAPTSTAAAPPTSTATVAPTSTATTPLTSTAPPEDGVARPAWAATDPVMRAYFDSEWGVPVHDERGLFEALSLEVFQAGLSWSTVLRKREAFRTAFAGFDPEAIARFATAEVERLMQDEGIVRNRRKIESTIQNARATLELRPAGGLTQLVWSFEPQSPTAMAAARAGGPSPESTALAKALRSKGFAFVGPTTMHALMEAVGVIDAHPQGRAR